MKNPETWKYRTSRNYMRELARLSVSGKLNKTTSSLKSAFHPTIFQNIVVLR